MCLLIGGGSPCPPVTRGSVSLSVELQLDETYFGSENTHTTHRSKKRFFSICYLQVPQQYHLWLSWLVLTYRVYNYTFEKNLRNFIWLLSSIYCRLLGLSSRACSILLLYHLLEHLTLKLTTLRETNNTHRPDTHNTHRSIIFVFRVPSNTAHSQPIRSCETHNIHRLKKRPLLAVRFKLNRHHIPLTTLTDLDSEFFNKSFQCRSFSTR